MPHSSVSGTSKLAQDLANFVNNPVSSDVKFLVGRAGDTPPVTIYGHSVILRARCKYFDTMFGNKELNSTIEKPNISPAAFRAVLEYLYTGDFHATKNLLLELISAAEEMELQELSSECQ